MATLDVPPNYQLVTYVLKHTIRAKPFTVHHGYRATITSLEITPLANALKSHFTTNVMPQMDSDVTCQRVHILARIGVGLFSGDSNTPGVAGGNGGAFPPNNSAAIFSIRGAPAGKANRGRMYMPSMVSEANVGEDGVIDSARLAVLQTTAQDWFSDINDVPAIITGVEGEVVVLHYPGSPVATPTDVDTITVRPTVGTQRRRIR
jgi:hypothetical protein